ncbi:MAG: hypothetical protein ACI4PP_05375 [Clostridia bacterium]
MPVSFSDLHNQLEVIRNSVLELSNFVAQGKANMDISGNKIALFGQGNQSALRAAASVQCASSALRDAYGSLKNLQQLSEEYLKIF